MLVKLLDESFWSLTLMSLYLLLLQQPGFETTGYSAVRADTVNDDRLANHVKFNPTKRQLTDAQAAQQKLEKEWFSYQKKIPKKLDQIEKLNGKKDYPAAWSALRGLHQTMGKADTFAAASGIDEIKKQVQVWDKALDAQEGIARENLPALKSEVRSVFWEKIREAESLLNLVRDGFEMYEDDADTAAAYEIPEYAIEYITGDGNDGNLAELQWMVAHEFEYKGEATERDLARARAVQLDISAIIAYMRGANFDSVREDAETLTRFKALAAVLQAIWNELAKANPPEESPDFNVYPEEAVSVPVPVSVTDEKPSAPVFDEREEVFYGQWHLSPDEVDGFEGIPVERIIKRRQFLIKTFRALNASAETAFEPLDNPQLLRVKIDKNGKNALRQAKDAAQFEQILLGALTVSELPAPVEGTLYRTLVDPVGARLWSAADREVARIKQLNREQRKKDAEEAAENKRLWQAFTTSDQTGLVPAWEEFQGRLKAYAFAAPDKRSSLGPDWFTGKKIIVPPSLIWKEKPGGASGFVHGMIRILYDPSKQLNVYLSRKRYAKPETYFEVSVEINTDGVPVLTVHEAGFSQPEFRGIWNGEFFRDTLRNPEIQNAHRDWFLGTREEMPVGFLSRPVKLKGKPTSRRKFSVLAFTMPPAEASKSKRGKSVTFSVNPDLLDPKKPVVWFRPGLYKDRKFMAVSLRPGGPVLGRVFWNPDKKAFDDYEGPLVRDFNVDPNRSRITEWYFSNPWDRSVLGPAESRISGNLSPFRVAKGEKYWVNLIWYREEGKGKYIHLGDNRLVPESLVSVRAFSIPGEKRVMMDVPEVPEKSAAETITRFADLETKSLLTSFKELPRRYGNWKPGRPPLPIMTIVPPANGRVLFKEAANKKTEVPFGKAKATKNRELFITFHEKIESGAPVKLVRIYGRSNPESISFDEILWEGHENESGDMVPVTGFAAHALEGAELRRVQLDLWRMGYASRPAAAPRSETRKISSVDEAAEKMLELLLKYESMNYEGNPQAWFDRLKDWRLTFYSALTLEVAREAYEAAGVFDPETMILFNFFQESAFIMPAEWRSVMEGLAAILAKEPEVRAIFPELREYGSFNMAGHYMLAYETRLRKHILLKALQRLSGDPKALQLYKSLESETNLEAASTDLLKLRSEARKFPFPEKEDFIRAALHNWIQAIGAEFLVYDRSREPKDVLQAVQRDKGPVNALVIARTELNTEKDRALLHRVEDKIIFKGLGPFVPLTSFYEAAKNAIVWGNHSDPEKLVVVRWQINPDGQNAIVDLIDEGRDPIDFGRYGKLPAGVAEGFYGNREGYGRYYGRFVDPQHFTDQGIYNFPLLDSRGKPIGQIVRLIFPKRSETRTVDEQVKEASGLKSEVRSDEKSVPEQIQAAFAAKGYAIRGEVEGWGGTSEVYYGKRNSDGQRVAIKVAIADEELADNNPKIGTQNRLLKGHSFDFLAGYYEQGSVSVIQKAKALVLNYEVLEYFDREKWQPLEESLPDEATDLEIFTILRVLYTWLSAIEKYGIEKTGAPLIYHDLIPNVLRNKDTGELKLIDLDVRPPGPANPTVVSDRNESLIDMAAQLLSPGDNHAWEKEFTKRFGKPEHLTWKKIGEALETLEREAGRSEVRRDTFPDLQSFANSFRLSPYHHHGKNYFSVQQIAEKEKPSALYALGEIERIRVWADEAGMADRPVLLWQNLSLAEFFPVLTPAIRKKLGIVELTAEDQKDLVLLKEPRAELKKARFVLLKWRIPSAFTTKYYTERDRIRALASGLNAASIVMTDHSKGLGTDHPRGLSEAQEKFADMEDEAKRATMVISLRNWINRSRGDYVKNPQPASPEAADFKRLLQHGSQPFIFLNANADRDFPVFNSAFDDWDYTTGFKKEVTIGSRKEQVIIFVREYFGAEVEKAYLAARKSEVRFSGIDLITVDVETERAEFEAAVRTAGVGDLSWPAPVWADYRNYLAGIAEQNFGQREKWRRFSFNPLWKDKTPADSLKIVRQYDVMPSMKDPEIQALAEFAARNPQASLQIYLPQKDREELSLFRIHLREEILERRKALGSDSPALNLVVESSASASAKEFKTLGTSRTLVFGDRKDFLRDVSGAVAAARRAEVLLVHNDFTGVSADPLKQTGAFLTALDRILSQQPLPSAIQQAANLLTENLALYREFQDLILHSA